MMKQKPPRENKTRVNISISPSDLIKLKRLASLEGISASQWISNKIRKAK
jgi:predicted DNA binding CopG/RHH family protein